MLLCPLVGDGDDERVGRQLVPEFVGTRRVLAPVVRVMVIC